MSHGQKRNETELHNGDHLASIWFGPPLKAAKSNPELTGDPSILGGCSRSLDTIRYASENTSRVPPLGRSNATRKRNIEPDNSTSSKSTVTLGDGTAEGLDVVVGLADAASVPVFRGRFFYVVVW